MAQGVTIRNTYIIRIYFVLSIRIIYTITIHEMARFGIQVDYKGQYSIQYTQLPRAVNRGISVSTNKLVALFHNLRLLFRWKKPNYT